MVLKDLIVEGCLHLLLGCNCNWEKLTNMNFDELEEILMML